jgi:hypothetical protein
MANGLIVYGAGERSYRRAERVRTLAKGVIKHTHTHTLHRRLSSWGPHRRHSHTNPVSLGAGQGPTRWYPLRSVPHGLMGMDLTAY